MPRSTFSRTLSVPATSDTVWQTLTDVPRLVSWVSIIEAAEEVIELASYRAVLMDRLGPFKLRAELDITVSDVEIGRRLVIRAVGEDRQVGSRLSVDASMLLTERDGATEVLIDGAYEVTGRVAAMGSGTINKKASRIIDEFFSSADAALATS